MLLNIAICDDDKSICNQLEDIIISYQNSYQKNIDIQVFISGESLCYAIEKNNNFDLIFLDIELCSLNGIDVGKMLRKRLNNQIVQIVYISGKEKYAMDLFELRPLNFLIKPLDPRNIIESIELCISLLNKLNGYFSYKIGFDTIRVPVKEIIYFESVNRKINIFTKLGTESFYGKLEEIYEDIKEYQFLYIHKSYLVNYNFVELFKYDVVVLPEGIELPISHSRRKTIREQSQIFANKE